jgi:hypothetical protein
MANTSSANPGDSWNIAGDVEHGATAVVDSVVVEVFSPVREDYLPYYSRKNSLTGVTLIKLIHPKKFLR